MQNSQLPGDVTNRRAAVYCRCLIDCPDGSDNSTCLLSRNGKLSIHESSNFGLIHIIVTRFLNLIFDSFSQLH